MQITVGKHFQLIKKLSSGSFGQIYLAINKKNDQQVAVKIQSINTKHPQLQYQAKLLAYLNQSSKQEETQIPGIPKIYYYGKDNNCRSMAMELLGPSLQELFQRCDKKFDIKTTVMCGLQMITRVQFLHSRKFIHRDIKPQNFLLGTHAKCNAIYLIDYGLSKKYLQKDGSHISYKDNKSLTGTPRYASINSHLGIQQSRRDDLESIIYMLIYFLRGSLPWQSLKSDGNLDKYQKILQRKLAVSVENLTHGLPEQIGQILNYIKNLHFIEQPDYQHCRDKLRECYDGQINQETLFCWEEIKVRDQVDQDFNF